jgi:hypothetical protein
VCADISDLASPVWKKISTLRTQNKVKLNWRGKYPAGAGFFALIL